MRLIDLSEIGAAHHILAYAATPSEVVVDAALQHWIDVGVTSPATAWATAEATSTGC